MLGGRTQGPYLPSRVSTAGAQQPSRRPGRTEALASAAPSPEPCCGPWMPGRLLRARPSGFGPGRLNPSPPRVRAFLPRASQAGPLRGPLWYPSLPAPIGCRGSRAPARASRRPPGRAGGRRGGGTRAGSQEAGSPARPPRWAERPALAPSAGVTRGWRPERAGRSRVRPRVQGAACCTRPLASTSGLLGTKVEPRVHLLVQHPKLLPPTVRGLETWGPGSGIRN